MAQTIWMMMDELVEWRTLEETGAPGVCPPQTPHGKAGIDLLAPEVSALPNWATVALKVVGVAL